MANKPKMTRLSASRGTVRKIASGEKTLFAGLSDGVLDRLTYDEIFVIRCDGYGAVHCRMRGRRRYPSLMAMLEHEPLDRLAHGHMEAAWFFLYRIMRNHERYGITVIDLDYVALEAARETA